MASEGQRSGQQMALSRMSEYFSNLTGVLGRGMWLRQLLQAYPLTPTVLMSQNGAENLRLS